MDITIDCPPRIDVLRPWREEGESPTVHMLRLDLIDPEIGGNKVFKLQGNLDYARDHGYQQLISFGGPHSNHLLALAVSCARNRLLSLGIVRGLDWEAKLTPTLLACRQWGMRLRFLSREEYGRISMDEVCSRELTMCEGKRSWVIPSGGANKWGRKGAAAIARFIPPLYTHILVSAGTGTTAIGLRTALPRETWLGAYTPLKGGATLRDEWIREVPPEKRDPFEVFDQWAGRGFGKSDPRVFSLMNRFYLRQGIALDHVYTAKMVLGLEQQLEQGFFPPGARLLLIHTGGLQGNAAVKQHLIF